MTDFVGRLLLAGVVALAVVSAAPAQTAQWTVHFPEDSSLPSHRPLDSGIGDLNGAEDLLARRLGRTRDLEAIQDIVRQGLADPNVVRMLKDKFKNLDDRTIRSVQDTIQKHPELLDDPRLRDMLKNFEEAKKNSEVNDALPKQTQDALAKWAKDYIEKSKATDPVTGDPITSRPPDPTNPANPPLTAPPKAPPQPPAEKPGGLGHEMIEGVADWIKDLDRSPEGEALRTAALKELAKMDLKTSGSSDLADFFKKIVSSDDAAWLTKNFKLPSAPNLGGWSPPTVAVGAPSLGGPTDGTLDAVVWVAALALLGSAGWVIFTMACKQAAAARVGAWTPGPWPMPPSQVSTRHDLIRAFEHLAYLLLGRQARSLNHLDAAARLGGDDAGRAAAASRLARLYEQARYAPPEEPLPADELTAARGDLAALAGAAA